MKLKGNKAKAIATLGIASALVFGAGGTALAARSMSLSSAALTSTVSTESVKSADQKLGLSDESGSSSKKGGAEKSASKASKSKSSKGDADDSVSSKRLAKEAARTLPKHSVSEADKLAKSGAALEEKLEAGKAVSAEKYLKTLAGAKSGSKSAWKTTTASTYGEGDGLMGSTCSDGSTVTASSMGVAHKTLALGTKIQIMYGGKIVEATVCDRGPFVQGREIDLQPAVKRALGFSGVGTVKYRVLK